MAELTHILKKISASNGAVVEANDDDIKKIQENLLPILDDIIECCNKNGINWQMSGGSALGAIRHKGYIPWDDDLDINMTRSDFDKFISAFEKEYGYKYWIHAPKVSDDYDRLTPRVISKEIRARDIFNCDIIECGLWVDIFVMENTPNNKILRKIHGLGCMGIRYLLSCIRFVRNEKEFKKLFRENNEFYKIAGHRTEIGKVLYILPLSFWMRLAMWWLTLYKNKRTEDVVIVSGSKQYFDEIYNKEKMCELIDVEFEGRIVKITKDYDAYMKNLYGDYMKIPSKEQQEHHIFMELDRAKLYK